MAHLTQVRVRGDASGAESVLAGYLNHLTSEPLFNRFEAERYLLLASDFPGYTVRLTLRPAGTGAGRRHRRRHGPAPPRLCRFRHPERRFARAWAVGRAASGAVFGLTGLGDRTSLALLQHSRPQGAADGPGRARHAARSTGLSLSGSFTYAWAAVDRQRPRARQTLLSNVELGYPLVRRQAQTIRGAIGFDFINQNVEVDAHPADRDRLRVAFGRIGFDAAGTDYGRTPELQPTALACCRAGRSSPGPSTFSAPPILRIAAPLADVPAIAPSRRRGGRPRRSCAGL